MLMENIIPKNSYKMNIIMIDAFKPEYLRYAPCLSSLTRKYQWGKLEMPPGHGGGMEIFFKGKSNKLCTFYKKDNSSLSWIKYFTWLGSFGRIGRTIIDCILNFSLLIKGKELHRTGKIPLKQLYKFEMVDSKEAWKGLGINYTYLSDVDVAGHKFGTKSKEVIEEIKKIDEKISKMKFDVILSDHGMIDVKKTVSVPLIENCFIDSDMARYWGNEEELKEVKKKLPLSDGKILDWPDKSYGGLIFLANPGILVSPNYWYGKRRIKGMHGYDGKHKDMKAFYIFKKKGRRKDLKVMELHKLVFKNIA